MPNAATPSRIAALRPLLLTGLAMVLAAAIGGLAFGGWVAHGPAMLDALWVAGLSWCM